MAILFLSAILQKKKLGKKRKLIPKNEEMSERKSHIQKLDRNILMITDAFLDQKRVNVCEHVVTWHSL